MTEKAGTCCQESDCTEEATTAARLNVPWQGFDYDDQAVSVVMGLKFCDSHFKKLNPKDWLMFDHPQGMHKIFDFMSEMRARTKSGFQLDYSRAYFSRVSFNSEEWKMLQNGQAEKKN